MRLFEIGILPPAGSDGFSVLLAAARAGELPLLDASTLASIRLRSGYEQLADVPGAQLGLRVDIRGIESALRELPKDVRFELVVVSGADAGNSLPSAIAALRPRAARIFREVVSIAEAEQAVTAGIDGLVAKGNESGGGGGTQTTLVLAQQLPGRFDFSPWGQGGTGPT